MLWNPKHNLLCPIRYQIDLSLGFKVVLVASQKLADAAEVIGKQPIASQLRFLQSLSEESADNDSTIVSRCHRPVKTLPHVKRALLPCDESQSDLLSRIVYLFGERPNLLLQENVSLAHGRSIEEGPV
jgi:hypothetical protein